MRKGMSSLRSFSLNIALAVATVLVFLQLMELSYRLYQRLNYGVPVFGFFSGNLDDQTAVAGATQLAIGHPLLHYTLNPDRASHTADFTRVTPAVHSPDFEIFCFGGSSTYGTGLSAAETYPSRLQESLGRFGVRAKVHNAGVPGWSLPHHITNYIFNVRNRSPRPHWIVLYAGYNDTWSNVSRSNPASGHLDGLKLFPQTLPFWMNYRSLIWIVGRVRVGIGLNLAPVHLNDLAFREREPYRVNATALGRFRSELKLFVDLITKDKVGLLIVLQDTNGKFLPGEKEVLAEVQGVIREVASEARITLIDSHAATRGKPQFFLDTIHHSAEGAAAVGDFVARGLARAMGRAN